MSNSKGQPRCFSARLALRHEGGVHGMLRQLHQLQALHSVLP